MELKYYDLLSNTIIGVVAIAVFKTAWFNDKSLDVEVYIAGGYLLGYFINAIGSATEPILYKLIGGMPSDKLLTFVEDHEWTGINKVKFFEAKRVVGMLKKSIGDNKASTGRMFAFAKGCVISNSDNRVSDFNAQYVFARGIFICVIVVFIFLIPQYYCLWYFWAIGLSVLWLSWNRFRERGYYFAREVLCEYMKKHVGE